MGLVMVAGFIGYGAWRLAVPALVGMGTRAPEVLSELEEELPVVRINQSWGNMWRDVVANGLRLQVPEGWLVTTEEYFATPQGRRFLDVAVWNDLGELVGGIETKTGASPYTLQLLKDEWLMLRYNFPIFEYRYPFSSKPWF